MILLAIKTFILFSNEFLSIQGDIFALIGYCFKINVFNILTGQKRDMTELKFVWLVNMTDNRPKIILSPVGTGRLFLQRGPVRLNELYMYSSNGQFLQTFVLSKSTKLWRLTKLKMQVGLDGLA